MPSYNQAQTLNISVLRAISGGGQDPVVLGSELGSKPEREVICDGNQFGWNGPRPGPDVERIEA